jgi:hypothetical protein
LELTEHEIFAPGEKRIEYWDEEGNVLYEEPIVARTFAGRVAATREFAAITIAPEGIYGVIAYNTTSYSLQPLAWNGGVVTQEVIFDGSLPGTLPEAQVTLQAENPTYSPSATDTILYTLYIKPVSEPAFRNYASDWQNRIQNGYFYSSASSMWEGESSIGLSLRAMVASASHFYASVTCGSSSSTDLGLIDFENWIRAYGGSGINSYGLWHGVNDAGTGQGGCARLECDGTNTGCLQYTSATTGRRDAAHAIMAVDVTSTDGWDPNRSDYLGKVTSHELTHNAGEPTHPTDGNCWFGGSANLMDTAETYSCIGFWRTSTTKSRVSSYAPPRLTG